MTDDTSDDIDPIIDELVALAHRDLDPAHCDERQARDAALRLTVALAVVADQGGLDAHYLRELFDAWVAGRSDDEGDTFDPDDVEAT